MTRRKSTMLLFPSYRRRIGADCTTVEKDNTKPLDCSSGLRPILIKDSHATKKNDSERTTATARMTPDADEEDSVTSTSPASSSRHPNRRKSSSSVSFETVTIHEFGYEWGDHPWTRSGVPLSLSWEPFETRSLDVDAYERTKHSPPGFPGNVLTPQQRRDILIRAGYAPSVVLLAEAELDKERHQRDVEKLLEEQRQLRMQNYHQRQRRFVKDLRSLRFGISATASYRQRRKGGNEDPSRHASSPPALISAR